MALATRPEDKSGKGGKSALIEFTRESRDDPNEDIVFGDAPVHCVCPHCERSVITFIDYETSWVTWILGFVVWFSLGWMAFWVLPLLWPAFKDVVHHCPRCLNVIARKSRISLPTFRSEIMTFKIGSCAVVLARKYVVILVGLIGIIVTVAVLRSTVHLQGAASDTMPKGPASSLTWEDFLYDCGPRTSLRHRSSTARAFEERYRRKTFKWQGEVRQIREGFDVLFLRTKSVVMVRMYPPRYPRRDISDIALLFGDERNNEVGSLNPGDWVEFEGTMTAHGHRGDPEVMVLWHIGVAPRPSPLSSTGKSGSAVERPPQKSASSGSLSAGTGRASTGSESVGAASAGDTSADSAIAGGAVPQLQNSTQASGVATNDDAPQRASPDSASDGKPEILE